MDNKTYKMVLVSLFAALTAVGAFIRIPVPPVSFTMQTCFVVFAGLILGARLGFAAQAVYIAIGLVGVPVFASGGGIQYILNPTFGYLVGFMGAAFVTGAIAEKITKPSFIRYFLASLVGLLPVYLIGVPYLYVILKYVNHAQVSFWGVAMSGFIVFIPWDIVKVAFASLMAKEIYVRAGFIFKQIKLKRN